MSYNGWSNRETWLVNLWLCETLDAMAYGGETVTAELIESLVGDLTGRDNIGGLAADLLESTLALVNWSEIASAYKFVRESTE